METSSTSHPTTDLPTHLYYQLVHTLTSLLPPPLDDTPEALSTRNHAAIARVAAMLPVNADEADLAAQCIAARAQAEELLWLTRKNAHDVLLVMRLNAQYSSMVRTSLSVHGRLMKVQAVRRKRQTIEGAADQDAWAQHIAERSMLEVTNPDAEPHQAAWPEAVPPETVHPGWLEEPPPSADVDQSIEKHVSKYEENSQDMACETWLSGQLSGPRPGQPDGRRLHRILRKAMAEAR